MVINPNSDFARVELGRIKWFLENLDLTVNEEVGSHIEDACESVRHTIKLLEVATTSSPQLK